QGADLIAYRLDVERISLIPRPDRLPQCVAGDHRPRLVDCIGAPCELGVAVEDSVRVGCERGANLTNCAAPVGLADILELTGRSPPPVNPVDLALTAEIHQRPGIGWRCRV